MSMNKAPASPFDEPAPEASHRQPGSSSQAAGQDSLGGVPLMPHNVPPSPWGADEADETPPYEPPRGQGTPCTSIKQSIDHTVPACCWVCPSSSWILSVQKPLFWAFLDQLAVRPGAVRSSRTQSAQHLSGRSQTPHQLENVS